MAGVGHNCDIFARFSNIAQGPVYFSRSSVSHTHYYLE